MVELVSKSKTTAVLRVPFASKLNNALPESPLPLTNEKVKEAPLS